MLISFCLISLIAPVNFYFTKNFSYEATMIYHFSSSSIFEGLPYCYLSLYLKVNSFYFLFSLLPRYILYLARCREQTVDWMAEKSGFGSQQGQKLYIFSIACTPTLQPIQSLSQGVPVVLSTGESGRVVDLTTRQHLVPKLRTSGSIPPSSIYTT
jgi:hypothetical protein